MNESRAPLLTIGIPLHRSRPWIDVVNANIEAVDRPDVEFLLSDRTGLDDALDVLAARHRTDGRVAALRVADGSNWVEHCNALLRQARGTYFCWMPHDDDFPRGWVDTLLGYLEAEPDLLMAFGHIERVIADETAPDRVRSPHPPIGTGCGPWTVDVAIAVLGRWRGGYAFRGMFGETWWWRAGSFCHARGTTWTQTWRGSSAWRYWVDCATSQRSPVTSGTTPRPSTGAGHATRRTTSRWPGFSRTTRSGSAALRGTHCVPSPRSASTP